MIATAAGPRTRRPCELAWVASEGSLFMNDGMLATPTVTLHIAVLVVEAQVVSVSFQGKGRLCRRSSCLFFPR